MVAALHGNVNIYQPSYVPGSVCRHRVSLEFTRPRTAGHRTPQHRERLFSCRAASSSGGKSSGDDFNCRAQEFSRIAGKRLRLAAEEIGDTVKRLASTVDGKFDVSGNAQKAAQGVKDQAEAVDEKFGVKRKLRTLADDTARKLPRWRKQYAEFHKTTAGKVVFYGAIWFLFSTGIAFRLLNLLFIMWWVAPLFILPAINYMNRKGMEEAERQYAEQRAAQSNPFYNVFGRAQQQQRRQQQARQARGGAGARGPPAQGGPIIDVEYSTVDDD